MRQALSMDHRKSFGVRVRAGGGRQRGAGASVVRVLGGSVGCWCGKLWWLADRLFFVDLLAESASVHISPWQSQILVVQDWHLVAAATVAAAVLCCCRCYCCAAAQLLPALLSMARDGFGIVGNAQRATAETRRGMRHNVPRVVSPTPSTRAARWG